MTIVLPPMVLSMCEKVSTPSILKSLTVFLWFIIILLQSLIVVVGGGVSVVVTNSSIVFLFYLVLIFFLYGSGYHSISNSFLYKIQHVH